MPIVIINVSRFNSSAGRHKLSDWIAYKNDIRNRLKNYLRQKTQRRRKYEDICRKR
jgi:hypothetical protein